VGSTGSDSLASGEVVKEVVKEAVGDVAEEAVGDVAEDVVCDCTRGIMQGVYKT
jgi:hypothetical protein